MMTTNAAVKEVVVVQTNNESRPGSTARVVRMVLSAKGQALLTSTSESIPEVLSKSVRHKTVDQQSSVSVSQG